MISIRLPKIKRNRKTVIGMISVMMIIGILFLKHKTEEVSDYETAIEETDMEETEKIATSQFLESDMIDEEKTDQKTESVEKPDADALYPVEIKDIYAQVGETVEFISFYPNAEKYTWEVYDMTEKEWGLADLETVFSKKDELYREVSILRLKAEVIQDGTMIRCTVNLEDGSIEKDMASLYVLQNNIKDISIDDIEIPKCGYISALEVPVNVIYEDDRSETITGLYGLKFLCSQESKEYDENVSGNLIEKRIETITECDYTYLHSGANERTLRYANLREKEWTTQITGCDREPPVIEEVIVGDYIVSREDKSVPIKIEIYAEDNETPYPKLKYAFAHEDTDPADIIFTSENEWNADINRNGTWIAYVMDESGNVAQMQKKIVTVDQMPPILTVNLKEMSWCMENMILVSGQDGTDLTYQIRKGEDCIYDWTEETNFVISENGIYTVWAKDEAGNETSQEITVENIDHQPPIIININEGEAQ